MVKHQFITATVLWAALSAAWAQVGSPARTSVKAKGADMTQPVSTPVQATSKVVVRVNGVVLTDHDLQSKMSSIFPYARLHNGIPKSMASEIRKGALQMIIFEELVCQEARRRNMTVPLARINLAETQFRKRFPGQMEFQRYLETEFHGSRQLLRSKLRRSLLIEALLKAEVGDKAGVSEAEAKAYYDSNPKIFEYGETFSIQTISFIPPPHANPEQIREARQRAEQALREARATKSYEGFGLLAEKVSEDDYHVNMGDHKAVDRAQLPPEVVQAALSMQPAQVSHLIQLGNNYTFFRLNAHTAAGKSAFEQVKSRLRMELAKSKYDRLRAALDQELRKKAVIEEL